MTREIPDDQGQDRPSSETFERTLADLHDQAELSFASKEELVEFDEKLRRATKLLDSNKTLDGHLRQLVSQLEAAEEGGTINKNGKDLITEYDETIEDTIKVGLTLETIDSFIAHLEAVIDRQHRLLAQIERYLKRG